MSARDVITAYLDAARSGDWNTAYGYFADDIVMHVPGESHLAGERRGKEAAIGYIQSVRDHYGHGNIELELIDILASDTRVALLVVERFLGDGDPLEIRRANVYRVEGDRIAAISIFEANQYEVDAMVRGISPGS